MLEDNAGQRWKYRVCLNGFLNNLASNLEQKRSSHSYGYGIRVVCPTFFATFPRNPVPSVNYPG
jgi:hypothetical protein